MYSSLDLCSMITIHLGNGLANLSAAHLELFCHSSIMLILSLFPRSLLDAHWVCLHQILPLFCPQTGWERVLRKRRFVITIPLLFYLWTFYPSTRLDFTLAIVLWILRTFFFFPPCFPSCLILCLKAKSSIILDEMYLLQLCRITRFECFDWFTSIKNKLHQPFACRNLCFL